jgi:hypothetical protein
LPNYLSCSATSPSERHDSQLSVFPCEPTDAISAATNSRLPLAEISPSCLPVCRPNMLRHEVSDAAERGAAKCDCAHPVACHRLRCLVRKVAMQGPKPRNARSPCLAPLITYRVPKMHWARELPAALLLRAATSRSSGPSLGGRDNTVVGHLSQMRRSWTPLLYVTLAGAWPVTSK